MKIRTIAMCLVALVALSARSPARAQTNTYNVLYNFGYTNNDDSAPSGGFVLSGKKLFGTSATSSGGSFGGGAIFSVNTDGSGFTNLHTFDTVFDDGTNLDGIGANFLVSAGDVLYGTTASGGPWGGGTVFRVNIDGSDLTNLYSFGDNTNYGGFPTGLTLSGNTLYGTTMYGGPKNAGTVFAVNTDGSSFTNLHSLDFTNDGFYPSGNVIVSGTNLFGVALGPSLYSGTVFAVNTDGSGFTNVHYFSAPGYSNSIQTNSDGGSPEAGLILSGNTLYGTTSGDGSAGNGTVFRVKTDGSGFTNLHNFSASSGQDGAGTNSDGSRPTTSLAISGSMLYGTTPWGGSEGGGTLFAVSTDGSGFVVLHNFTGSPTQSSYSQTGLIPCGNTLYGTTEAEGGYGYGSVFALSLFGPSLAILPAGNQTVISWTASTSNYILQAATDLSSGSWSNVTSAISTSGSNYVFTNAATNQAAYFRLLQQ
jgi:uncharacterized repeat protein (TIGR03803 family)